MVVGVTLLLACALGADARLDAGAATEARTRRASGGLQDQTTGTDLALAPHAELTVRGGRVAVDAGYEPRLTLTDVGPDVRREVMHDGRLRLRAEPSALWNVAMTATGGVGRTDLVTENQRPTLPSGTVPDVIATRAVLAVERAGLSLDLHVAPTRRLEVLLSSGASVGGGADALARALLPMERRATAGGEVRYSVTREDRLGVSVSGQASRVDAGDAVGPQTSSGFAVVLGTWRHQLSSVETWAGAGETWLYTRDAERNRWKPSGSAFAAELGMGTLPLARSVTGQAVTRLGAGIDRLTGEVSRQLEGSGTLNWAAQRTLALSASAGGALAWQRSGRSRRGELAVRAAWAVTPIFGAGLGAYGSWQRTPIAPSFTELGAFVALTFQIEPVTWRTGAE